MKILFISNYIPYQADSGTTIRLQNLLSCLSSEFDVVCVYVVDNRESNGQAMEACRLDVVNYLIESKKQPIGVKRYLVHLLELFTISGKIRTGLSKIMDKEKPNLVWVEPGYIGHLIPFMKSFGVPVVYGSHNSQFKLDLGIWKSNANIMYRLKMAPFVLLYYFHERLYFKMADLVLCVSMQDLAYYAGLVTPSKVRLMPFLFESSDLSSVPPLETNHPYLCMVGSLRSYQNYAAVIFAIEEVWPILSRKNDRLRLYIIGELPKESSPEYRRLTLSIARTGRVVLTGRVKSVIPFVKGAAAHLVTLSIGSGVRTKIIESTACGTPVVSTTIGAEGLPFVDGESIFIADTAETLAEKVLLIVNDGMTRRQLAEKAFAKYYEELSCEAGVRIIKQIFRDLKVQVE